MSAKICLTIIFLFGTLVLQAQEEWDLQKCIDYATENNIRIKQARLGEQVSENSLIQSKADLFPSVNGDMRYGVNFGKTIDPTTNAFVNQQLQTSSVGLSSSVTLFNGMRKINAIKQSRFDLLASQYSTQDLVDNISLQITSAYLQILMNIEELNSANERLRLSQEQVEQTQKLVDAGVLPEGNLYDVKAQLSNDSLNIVVAANSVELSKLNLALMLQLDDPTDFEIIVPEINVLDLTSLEEMNPENIYQTALTNQPSIKNSTYEIKSAEKDIQLTKGLHYPTLSFFYRFGTNHSSIGQRLIDNVVIENPVIGFVDDAQQTSVKSITDFNTPIFEDATLWQQYNDNLNQTLGFSLNIPVFNGFATRTAVRNAKLQLLNAQYNDQTVKDQLKNDVYIAYADAKAAFQKYFAASNNVNALNKSFEYVQKRFDLGAATTLDYSTARTNLTTAENTLISSKYDYLFKLKVLDYYLGNPITLD